MTKQRCSSINSGGTRCFHLEEHKGNHEGKVVINGQGIGTAFWSDPSRCTGCGGVKGINPTPYGNGCRCAERIES